MKWPLLIFAFYMFALSCVPCLCEAMHKSEPVEQQVASSSQSGENHEEDNCNPFCACSCCPSSAFYYQRNFSIAKPAIRNIASSFVIIDQSFTSYNSHNIWQPPRA